MMHRTAPNFWKHYQRLPNDVQKLADKNFQILNRDPRHPSLHFKKVGNLWSVRIGLNHRALAIEDGSDFIWGWIGTHDEYNRMIRDH